MATVQRASMIQYPDGQVVIHNIRKKRLSIPVFGPNEAYSATLVTSWWDGTPMDDSKADGNVYFKLKKLPEGADSGLSQYIGSYFKVNLPNDGELFLEKDTMAEMRDLNSTEILLLQMGYYKGVKLNGYHAKGDTPAPIEYTLSNTSSEDDGGSVIQIGSIKVEHEFINEVDVRYYGARAEDIDGWDDQPFITKCLQSNPSKRIKFEGYFRLYDTVHIPTIDSTNSHQYVFDGNRKLSSGGLPNTYNDGMSVISYYGPDGQSAFESSSLQTWVELDSLMIRDRSGGTNTVGFKVDHYRSQRMTQVYILGFGINLSISGDYYYSVFDKCSFTHAKQDSVVTGGLANGAKFETCRISLSQGRGLVITNGGDVVDLINCYIEGNSGPGVEALNIRNVNIFGGYIEKNGSGTTTGGRHSQIVLRVFNNSPGVKAQINIIGSHCFCNQGTDLVYCTSNTGSSVGNQCVNLDGISLVASDLNSNYNSETPTYVVYGTSRSKVELNFNNINYHLIENKFKLFNGTLSNFKSVNFTNDQNAESTFLKTSNYSKTQSFSNLELVSPIQNADGSNSDHSSLDINNLTGVLGSRIRFFQNQLGADNVVEFYNSSGGVSARIVSETGDIEGNLSFSGGNQRVLGGMSEPEGNVSAWQGSIYLRADGINSYLYRKHSGTGNTGWRRIVDEGMLATTSVKGVVNQSAAEANITTADATDETEAVALVNELKAKINSILASDRVSGQRAT